MSNPAQARNPIARGRRGPATQYAGDSEMARIARRDMRNVLGRLMDAPRGTNAGTWTPDSCAYVAEIQRVFAYTKERR
jgi:hypothetical protein